MNTPEEIAESLMESTFKSAMEIRDEVDKSLRVGKALRRLAAAFRGDQVNEVPEDEDTKKQEKLHTDMGLAIQIMKSAWENRTRTVPKDEIAGKLIESTIETAKQALARAKAVKGMMVVSKDGIDIFRTKMHFESEEPDYDDVEKAIKVLEDISRNLL